MPRRPSCAWPPSSTSPPTPPSSPSRPRRTPRCAAWCRWGSPAGESVRTAPARPAAAGSIEQVVEPPHELLRAASSTHLSLHPPRALPTPPPHPCNPARSTTCAAPWRRRCWRWTCWPRQSAAWWSSRQTRVRTARPGGCPNWHACLGGADRHAAGHLAQPLARLSACDRLGGPSASRVFATEEPWRPARPCPCRHLLPPPRAPAAAIGPPPQRPGQLKRPLDARLPEVHPQPRARLPACLPACVFCFAVCSHHNRSCGLLPTVPRTPRASAWHQALSRLRRPFLSCSARMASFLSTKMGSVMRLLSGGWMPGWAGG